MLERRFAYAAPVESHFVHYFHRLTRLWPPSSPAARERYLQAVMLFLEAWVPVNNRVRDADTAKAYSLLAVRGELHDIAESATSMGELVDGLFSAFARLQGAESWVEQSVYAHPGKLAHLEDYPRSSRVIHLVRDGRDTCLSWCRTWFAPASLVQAAWYWRSHVRAARRWGKGHPDRYLEIRYEDLIGDEDRTMARIADFVGSAPGSGRFSGLAEVLAAGGTHDLIRGGALSSNKEKWRSQMGEKDIARFEKVAARELTAFGYPLSGGGQHGRVNSAGLALRLLADGCRPQSLRRRSKFLLAAWCWARARLAV